MKNFENTIMAVIFILGLICLFTNIYWSYVALLYFAMAFNLLYRRYKSKSKELKP